MTCVTVPGLELGKLRNLETPLSNKTKIILSMWK